MLYRVTLPTESGYMARSHYGVGTFIAGEPRTVDLTPEYAQSLRAKGYKVEEVREHAPRSWPTRKHTTTREPETNEED